jgi:hypothetical protein
MPIPFVPKLNFSNLSASTDTAKNLEIFESVNQSFTKTPVKHFERGITKENLPSTKLILEELKLLAIKHPEGERMHELIRQLEL